MGTASKIFGGLVCILALGLFLPSLVVAAGICEPCTQDADCDSNNCGVNVSDPNDKRCIPAGAQSYECSSDDSGCFVDVADLFGEQANRYQVTP
ncbi:MAG: hypothetical protein AMJ54_01820 [Deltaproteobacteria bacterium SG8_13]|nr:MAG: hypothetical protein AMJ54_01820 [Deltaproteobacteria bacterium SG8_13]